MIQNVDSFIHYFDGIRRRTLMFTRAIPEDRIDWSPQTGAFSCGDILRHLAAVETITIHAVVHDQWQTYPGHDKRLAANLVEVMNYLEATHADSMNLLHTLPDSGLELPRPAITGRLIKAWQLLMSVIEHEVHHRSQLASYLEIMGVEPPQIFGLQVDDVAAFSAQMARKDPGSTDED